VEALTRKVETLFVLWTYPQKNCTRRQYIKKKIPLPIWVIFKKIHAPRSALHEYLTRAEYSSRDKNNSLIWNAIKVADLAPRLFKTWPVFLRLEGIKGLHIKRSRLSPPKRPLCRFNLAGIPHAHSQLHKYICTQSSAAAPAESANGGSVKQQQPSISTSPAGLKILSVLRDLRAQFVLFHPCHTAAIFLAVCKKVVLLFIHNSQTKITTNTNNGQLR